MWYVYIIAWKRKNAMSLTPCWSQHINPGKEKDAVTLTLCWSQVSDVMRLHFSDPSPSANKGMKCMGLSGQTKSSVTHILLVMKWDKMSKKKCSTHILLVMTWKILGKKSLQLLPTCYWPWEKCTTWQRKKYRIAYSLLYTKRDASW